MYLDAVITDMKTRREKCLGVRIYFPRSPQIAITAAWSVFVWKCLVSIDYTYKRMTIHVDKSQPICGHSVREL